MNDRMLTPAGEVRSDIEKPVLMARIRGSELAG